jgi:hypothetical protein
VNDHNERVRVRVMIVLRLRELKGVRDLIRRVRIRAYHRSVCALCSLAFGIPCPIGDSLVPTKSCWEEEERSKP